MDNNHIIHQIISEITLSLASQNYLDANNEIEEYKNIIIETVTDFFNQLNTENNIYIDEIVLQLDTVTSKDEFKNKLLQQLESWQKNHPGISAFTIEKNTGENTTSSSFLENENINLEYILNFLRTGYFPWELLDEKREKIIADQNNEAQLHSYCEKENSEKILLMFIEKPSIFLRLLHYFPAVGQSVFKRIILSDTKKSELNYHIADHLVNLVLQNKINVNPEDWKLFFSKLHQIVFGLGNHISLQIFLIVFIQTKNLSNPYLLKQNSFSKNELVENQYQIIQTFFSATGFKIQADKDLVLKTIRSIYFESINEEVLSETDNQYLSESGSEKKPYRLYPNCGIILLHPFFKTLFGEFGLLEEKTFQSFSKQVKAVQVLLYLSTSDDCFDEKEIQFLKLIVGLQPEDFIQWTQPLTSSEKQSCNEVLSVLIKEWSILKNTSASTVQTQFLQRKGLVENSEKSIEIKCQKNTLDILLDHFPYNYSIVKLPWLQKLIVMLDAL